MKQFFLSAALLIGTALSFTACNNGVYDTDPASNNSSTGNPFNTGNGSGSGALGSIVFKANGTSVNISNGAWQEFSATDRIVLGITNFGTNGYKSLSLNLGTYSGVKEYLGGPVDLKVYIDYSESTDGNNETSWSSGDGGTHGVTINVTDISNDQMKGTFNGTLYRLNSSLNIIDSVVVTEGTFNVPKHI